MTVTGEKANKKGAWRRKKTLMKKAFELGTFPGVDVAVFVYKRGQLDTFMSTDRPSWPPTKEEIKTWYPIPKTLTPRDFEKKEVILVQDKEGSDS